MLTIVVGVEESEHSLDALALARRLAGRDGDLLLVCVYPVDRPMAGDGGAADARGLHAAAEKTLARLGGEAGSQTLAVPDTHPAHALAQVAAEVGAAAIVVGSSRAGPLRRVLPGSTGEHLLESASCAVAIAPRGYREHAEQPIDVIVCAFDGTPEARRVLTVAEALARRLDAGLRVMRVVESNRHRRRDAGGRTRRPLRPHAASANVHWTICAASSPSSIPAWTRTPPFSTANRPRSSCGLRSLRTSSSPGRVGTARSMRCLRAPSRAA